jgi:hypothetical protein
MEKIPIIPAKLIAIGACYPCLTETCTHAKAEGSGFKHPVAGAQQPAAVTSFKGTLLCLACALDWAKRMIELKMAEEPSGNADAAARSA